MVDQINGLVSIIVTDSGGNSTDLPALVLASSGVYLQSKTLDLGSPHNEKHLSKIRVDLTGSAVPSKLSLKVGYKDYMEDDLVWTPVQYFTSLGQIFDYRISARYFVLYFEDELPVTKWSITSIEFYGTVMRGRL